MKQIFKVLGIALMAVCMGVGFASCDDDPVGGGGATYPEFNLDGFNLAHQWDINVTDVYCPEFTYAIEDELAAGLADGNLTMEFCYLDGEEEDETNNYNGWYVEFYVPNISDGGIANHRRVASIEIKYYNPRTQTLRLTKNEDEYESTVNLTQDSKKIIISWDAESELGNMQHCRFEGYVNKADVRF